MGKKYDRQKQWIHENVKKRELCCRTWSIYIHHQGKKTAGIFERKNRLIIVKDNSKINEGKIRRNYICKLFEDCRINEFKCLM